VRIKIDIPNDLDVHWGIDIKKSIAQPCEEIKNDLKRIINQITEKGSRPYTGRGRKIEDKNVVLANVATPSDTTADGAGITVLGATDKTFNWVDATDAWTSSENLNLLAGKVFEIAGTSVLSNTTLGSGIVNSSLTSLGTIATGVWNGTAIGYAYGGTGLTSYTTGDLVYASATNTVSKLGIGSAGQFLKVVSGVPAWSDTVDGGTF
jgi:hypothetical protein